VVRFVTKSMRVTPNLLTRIRSKRELLPKLREAESLRDNNKVSSLTCRDKLQLWRLRLRCSKPKRFSSRKTLRVMRLFWLIRFL